jgi:hypothetical protein
MHLQAGRGAEEAEEEAPRQIGGGWGTMTWMDRDDALNLGCRCSDKEDEASTQDCYWSATTKSMP